jgi:hypothetical protein
MGAILSVWAAATAVTLNIAALASAIFILFIVLLLFQQCETREYRGALCPPAFSATFLTQGNTRGFQTQKPVLMGKLTQQPAEIQPENPAKLCIGNIIVLAAGTGR